MVKFFASRVKEKRVEFLCFYGETEIFSLSAVQKANI